MTFTAVTCGALDAPFRAPQVSEVEGIILADCGLRTADCGLRTKGVGIETIRIPATHRAAAAGQIES